MKKKIFFSNVKTTQSTIINSERYVMYELDAIELHVETNKIKQIVRIVLFNDLLKGRPSSRSFHGALHDDAARIFQGL